MTDKFENINGDEINLNVNGELEISDALQDAVAGGFNPEAEEDEMPDDKTNINCPVTDGNS